MRTKEFDDGVFRRVRILLGEITSDALSGRDFGALPELDEALLDDAAARAAQDACSFLRRDPSLHNCADGVVAPGCSFRAVAANRLAHPLWQAAARTAGGEADGLRAAALALAFVARRECGVDIHPGARLGPEFVVDHGFGTVVGETVVTGAGCYILNGVVLGARGIASNRSGRRHPRLGDNVEIGSFACVLGPIEIGDDVFIGPHCVVLDDVPAGARVTVRHPVQLVRTPDEPALPEPALPEIVELMEQTR